MNKHIDRRHHAYTSHSDMSRRAFLKAMGGAAAGLLVAGCQGQGLPATTPALPISGTPAPSPATVAIVKAESYDRPLIRQQVQAALDAIGGIGDVIRPGASVAIKVNLTGGVGNPAPHNVLRSESYWTHPEVVRALGELLRDAGAKKLYMVESVYDAESYPEGGFVEAAKSIDATLVNLNIPEPYKDFYTASVGNEAFIYEAFPFNPVLDNVDAFVSVPKMKCHWNCGVTVSMKNLIGIGPLGRFKVKQEDNYRSAFHFGPDGKEEFKARLPRVILDLNRARPVNLSLVDGIVTTDGGEGPWIEGTHLQTPHVLLAGKNPVATDAVATAVMGFDPTADYPNAPFLRGDNHLNIARSLGLGTNRLEEIEVKGVAIEEVRQKFAPSGG